MEATAATLERRVRVIPATRKPEELHRDHDGKMRVAAYCRVSTDSEEQLNSYEAQKTYYTQKIQDSPDWEMAGIYADEGISGTSLKKRTQFNKMITACKRDTSTSSSPSPSPALPETWWIVWIRCGS